MSHQCALPPLTQRYLSCPEHLDVECECGALYVATETRLPPPLRYQWRKATLVERAHIRWDRWWRSIR